MSLRTLIRSVLTWGALVGLYLLLAGSASADELVAGAAVAFVATVLSVAVRAGSGCVFHLMPGVWLKPAMRALAAVPKEAAMVGFRLIVLRPGGFEEAPLAAASDDVATARAVGIIAGSLAPNRFVVDITGHDSVLVHRFSGAQR